MATTLSTFKGALASGGARPSLFDVTISKPSVLDVGNFDDMATQCTVSAIPPLTVTPIERQYFGRTVKIPGDMVFGDLSTTIINTENFSVRTPLELWMDKINSTATNYGFSNNASTFGSVTLTQYDKSGSSLLTWKFIDCWPQTISEIALSYDTASDIEQFDVTWAYNYYEQAKGIATTATTYASQL
jgi:hypothetical protein